MKGRISFVVSLCAQLSPASFDPGFNFYPKKWYTVGIARIVVKRPISLCKLFSNNVKHFCQATTSSTLYGLAAGCIEFEGPLGVRIGGLISWYPNIINTKVYKILYILSILINITEKYLCMTIIRLSIWIPIYNASHISLYFCMFICNNRLTWVRPNRTLQLHYDLYSSWSGVKTNKNG